MFQPGKKIRLDSTGRDFSIPVLELENDKTKQLQYFSIFRDADVGMNATAMFEANLVESVR